MKALFFILLVGLLLSLPEGFSPLWWALLLADIIGLVKYNLNTKITQL